MHKDLNRIIMAIGAHADDIEIGVGGTLAKYHKVGYEIAYIMSTNNMSGGVQAWEDGRIVKKPRENPTAMMKRRKEECAVAAAALDTIPIHLDHPQRHYNSTDGDRRPEVRYGCVLPDGVPPDVPTILTAYEDTASVQRLAELILEKNPECIFTHGVTQVNIEHFATCLLVAKAFWSAVERGYEGAILHWREPHTLHGDFNCQWETFVECTSCVDRKMELIGMHECQMPKAHLPDFVHRILTLSQGQACGVGAAELFTWVRRPSCNDIGAVSGTSPSDLTLELIQNSR